MPKKKKIIDPSEFKKPADWVEPNVEPSKEEAIRVIDRWLKEIDEDEREDLNDDF